MSTVIEEVNNDELYLWAEHLQHLDESVYSRWLADKIADRLKLTNRPTDSESLKVAIRRATTNRTPRYRELQLRWQRYNELKARLSSSLTARTSVKNPQQIADAAHLTTLALMLVVAGERLSFEIQVIDSQFDRGPAQLSDSKEYRVVGRRNPIPRDVKTGQLN